MFSCPEKKVRNDFTSIKLANHSILSFLFWNMRIGDDFQLRSPTHIKPPGSECCPRAILHKRGDPVKRLLKDIGLHHSFYLIWQVVSHLKKTPKNAASMHAWYLSISVHHRTTWACKKCANSRQNSQNWAKMGFPLLKITLTWKKYTTAGCGGCD